MFVPSPVSCLPALTLLNDTHWFLSMSNFCVLFSSSFRPKASQFPQTLVARCARRPVQCIILSIAFNVNKADNYCVDSFGTFRFIHAALALRVDLLTESEMPTADRRLNCIQFPVSAFVAFAFLSLGPSTLAFSSTFHSAIVFRVQNYKDSRLSC